MRKNLRITVDGRSYNVLVEELDQDAAIPHPADTAPASVVSPPPPTSPPPPSAPAAAAPAAAAGAIVAPIGGVVISIEVSVGRDVAMGDKVATIEAMKMQTDVRSKVAGKVTAIVAKVNDSVETGQALITLG